MNEMNPATGSFLSGLLQGFAQTQERRKLQEQDKKEKDARLKLFEVQLEREQQQTRRDAAAALRAEQQQKAQEELFGMMRGSPEIRPPLLNAGPATPGKGLLDILADPKGQMLAVQAGMVKGEDVINQDNSRVLREILQKIMGGSGGGGGAGGMQVSKVGFDTKGNPMFDFAPPQVKQWMVDSTGTTRQGVDAQGRIISTMPGSPNDRAPEDVPLPPSALSELRDANGNMLKPGTTLRQAQALGAKTVPKPMEADKRATMLLSGMQDAEQTIGSLKGSDTSSVGNAALASNPVTNLFTSNDYKKYEQAGLRWAANYLYLTSGAQQGEKETKTTFKTYFPQPGDSEEVKQQKRIARQQQIADIESAYASGKGALQSGQSQPQAGSLPPGIPAGSQLIGTSGGKPVYQTPDGKKLIIE